MPDHMDASAGPARRRGDYHKKYDTIDEIYWVLEQEAKAFSPETAVSVKELAALMKRSGNLDKPPAERTLSELLGRLYRDNLYVCSDTTADRHFPWKLECVLQRTSGNAVFYQSYAQWEQHHTEGQSPNRALRYYLQNVLTPSEWKLFADMVQVYPYISSEQSKKFLRVLNRMSHHPVLLLEDQRYAFRRDGTLDFSILEQLDDAIRRSRRVSVVYGEYRLQPHQGRLIPRLLPRAKYNPMELEPYAMVWSNGYYYLVGHHQKLGLMNLRVDRMVSITVLAEQAKRPPSFDPTQYRDSAPVMYAGVPEHIVLRCRTKLLNVVVDFFGASVPFFDVTDDHFSVHLHIVPAGAKLFIRQYLDGVEVLEPASLRAELAQELREAAARLEED